MYNVIKFAIVIQYEFIIFNKAHREKGGNRVMSITYELFFQIFNTLILMLIPVILILISITIFVKKNKLTNNKISELEKRINDLENK